jgi:hypothetical protein
MLKLHDTALLPDTGFGARYSNESIARLND